MPTITETEIARIADIYEATLTETFHRTTVQEERLYRECPSAFWLAPDADLRTEARCPPKPHAEPVVAAATPHDVAMIPTGYPAAILSPLLLAGPVFVATLGLVMEGSGAPLTRLGQALALALVSFPLTIPVGAILALLPVSVGVASLARLDGSRPVARDTRLWAATGAGLGLAIAALFDAGIVTVPLVLTAIACATMARRAIEWIEPEFA